MTNFVGVFGNGEEKEWPLALGMNIRGGMDELEFKKYIMRPIVPLYPNADVVNGRQVMLNANSAPRSMLDTKWIQR